MPLYFDRNDNEIVCNEHQAHHVGGNTHCYRGYHIRYESFTKYRWRGIPYQDAPYASKMVWIILELREHSREGLDRSEGLASTKRRIDQCIAEDAE
jgi:hypothetical protein